MLMAQFQSVERPTLPRRRGAGMATVKRLCVYCGASDLVDPVYRAAAVELGTRLDDAGIVLVYGGSRDGILLRIAAELLEASGRGHSEIPTLLRNRYQDHIGYLRTVYRV